MKRIKSVNGYTIYQAITARDEENYKCSIGNYNIYITQDIRDYGLACSYPEYDDIDSMATCLELANGSNYAVAVALADELSSSTVQGTDLVLEIERRLDAQQSIDYIRDHYDLDEERFTDLDRAEDTSRYAMRNLRKGDTFVVGGYMHTAGSDAHPSGDASYDGYIVYDIHGDSYFEEDFPGNDDDLTDDDDELDGDLEDVLDAALSAGDRADQNLDYDYQETELLCRAMRAAGYGYLGTDRDGELLRFTDDSMQDIVFTDWPEVREWLEYVVFDDPDVSDAVERVLHPERFTHEQQRRSHASYIVIETCDSDCQWLTVTLPRPAELTDDQYRNLFFRKVAERIAFADCGDEQVSEIVYDGEPCHYTGWQPGMVIEFASDLTGEIVYSGSFPEWDH